MRPLYETEANRINERAVAKLIEGKWNCKCVKLKQAYALDYALIRDGKVIAFMEIKCRNYTMDKLNSMGGFMISVHKWLEAKAICDVSSVPLCLVVRTHDGVWYHKTSDFLNDGIGFGGRLDRGDDQDVEPVILLKGNRFKNIGV